MMKIRNTRTGILKRDGCDVGKVEIRESRTGSSAWHWVQHWLSDDLSLPCPLWILFFSRLSVHFCCPESLGLDYREPVAHCYRQLHMYKIRRARREVDVWTEDDTRYVL